MKAILFLLSTSIALAVLCTASDSGCRDGCEAPGIWAEYNVFELRMTVPGEPGYRSWKGTFDKESSDIQIDVKTSDGSRVAMGRLLMVGGVS
jgi:hypothetical protein